MRAMLAMLVMAVTVAACGGRSVVVSTTPAPQTTTNPSVHFTNNLTQAVNVYVNSGGTDIFVKQVAANTTEHLEVQGVADGSVVTLKAKTVDGSRTYSKDNVTLSGMYAWQVP